MKFLSLCRAGRNDAVLRAEERGIEMQEAMMQQQHGMLVQAEKAEADRKEERKRAAEERRRDMKRADEIAQRQHEEHLVAL